MFDQGDDSYELSLIDIIEGFNRISERLDEKRTHLIFPEKANQKSSATSMLFTNSFSKNLDDENDYLMPKLALLLLRKEISTLRVSLNDKATELRHVYKELRLAREALDHANHLADVDIGETEDELHATLAALDLKHQKELSTIKTRHNDVQQGLYATIQELQEKLKEETAAYKSLVVQQKEAAADKNKLISENHDLQQQALFFHEEIKRVNKEIEKNKIEYEQQINTLKKEMIIREKYTKDVERKLAKQAEELISYKVRNMFCDSFNLIIVLIWSRSNHRYLILQQCLTECIR